MSKAKFLHNTVHSCAECPHMQVRAEGFMDSLSRPTTRMSAVCRLGMFDERVESANLFHFDGPSHTALKTLREEGFGKEIPDWCPLGDA